MNLYEALGSVALLVVSGLFLYMVWTMKKIPEEVEKR